MLARAMADFILAAMPFAGHVSPLLPVARALVARGHTVRWLGSEPFRAAITATGATVAPMSEAVAVDDAAIAARHPEAQQLTGVAAVRWALSHVFFKPVPDQVADLRRLVDERAPDVVVTDSAFVGGGVLHEVTGVPWATVGMVRLGLRSRDTAPFGPGLPPSRTPLGRLRNYTLYEIFERIVLRQVRTEYRRIRADLDLPPHNGPLLDAVSPALHLQNGVAEFEYPRGDLPRQVHFVGALVAAAGHVPLPDWWGDVESADRPVVHVTQGTTVKDLDDLVLPTIRLLADDDVLVVANIGDRDPATFGTLPANARVARFIPHDRLLPRVTAMVTNGGYGAVQTALLHGVPLVVAGNTEDKPEVAARVAWSGAGINLRTARPAPARLRAAIDAVLAGGDYRRNAERLGAVYRRFDGGVRCAELLEQLVATGRPVLAG
jgi:MGT family glycosyltransferase